MSDEAVRVYYDADTDRNRLDGRTFAIVGYGSQGHAHALNLRDSGARVIVGLRAGSPSAERAKAAGLDVRPVAVAAAAADTIMMLVPDQDGRAIYERDVAPGLAPGKTLMFAHGFNIHYGEIAAPDGVDVTMVAPKSPGHLVRSEYEAGRGVPALVAVHQDASGHRWPMPSPMHWGSAAPAPACSRPRSARRPRPTSSASRPCSAAASPRWSKPASRR